MKKLFKNIMPVTLSLSKGWGVRSFFTPRTWVRTRYERNGILLESKKVNGKPIMRLRIVKRNGGGTIDKDVPYSDVLMITKYPSPFAKKILGRRPKNYRVMLSPAGGGAQRAGGGQTGNP